jgi:hypothetical protein
MPPELEVAFVERKEKKRKKDMRLINDRWIGHDFYTQLVPPYPMPAPTTPCA